MDSGNSSSLQSSSGGEEESESRRESVPAFLSTSGHFSALSNQHLSLVSHHQDHHPPTLFDHSSSYFNPFSQSQPRNSVLNIDGVRPRSLRSEPNCSTDLGNPPGSSSSSQSILGSQGLNQGSFPGSSAMQQSRPVHDHNGVVKNPKKRTRASRRAPTTVLTTDTTNFRAMVQEFTGIPAPPFSGSSYSRRLDHLFGSGSSGLRSSHLEPLGSIYPLRPSAKRVQSTPFLSSSSPPLLNNPLVEAANSITNTSSNSSNAFNPSSSSNYQIPSQNMLNLQNQSPILTFQPFLQLDPPLHPSLNLPGYGMKSPGSSAPMASLDELGLSHAHVNANIGGLQGHETPEDGNRHGNWRDRVGLNEGNQDHLRPLFDGNNYVNNDHHSNSLRPNNNSCKLNYSAASSSDLHHDKGLENASSRAEDTGSQRWRGAIGGKIKGNPNP